jgi:hypothetical protein
MTDLRAKLRELEKMWRLRGRDLRESFLIDDALRVEECRAELLTALSAPDATADALRGLVEAVEASDLALLARRYPEFQGAYQVAIAALSEAERGRKERRG